MRPGPHRLGVAPDNLVVAGVHRGGVAQVAVLGDQHGGVDRVLHRGGADDPQHRHELLLHQRVPGQLGQVGRERGEQHLRGGVDLEARRVRQLRSGAPDGLHADLLPALEGELGQGQGLDLVRGEHVRAHPDELGHHLLVDGVVHDAGLLGRADHRGVERLGDQGVHDHARQVRAAVHVDRRVARPHAQPGLPGRVRQSDDPRTPGHPEEVHVRVPEQVVGHLVRSIRDDLQRPGRQAGLLAGLAQHPDRLLGAAHGVRRGPQQQRVARLGGEDRLVQHRGRRVGDRRDGQHDAHGLGHQLDVALDVDVHDAQRAHAPEGVGEELGGDEVLDHLVLEDPEPGLLDGQPRQAGRRVQAGAHHGGHDAIHRTLVQLTHPGSGCGRRGDQLVHRLPPRLVEPLDHCRRLRHVAAPAPVSGVGRRPRRR